jgi:flagellar hook protein FlgE
MDCRPADPIECGDNVMGIFDALTTAVGGLQSQSYALQNISGNIANASTVGYKGIDTTFEDLVAQSTTPTSQVAGGVQAFSQQTLTTGGTVSTSTVATNMAINGDGFFSVEKPTSVVDNQPVFNGVTDYTRAGDFQVNANGNLVNGAGYYLMGVAVDPKTGNPLGSVPTILQFQNNFVPAQPTSTIQYGANLPTTPATTASTTATAGSITAAGGLNPADFSSNPVVFGTAAPAYGNSAALGSAVQNEATSPAPITANTALAGTAGTDSLKASFTTSDTIVVTPSSGSPPVNGTPQTIAFYNTGALPAVPLPSPGAANTTYLDLATTKVGVLLSTIDTLTGNTTNPSTVSSTGAITLNTGVANNFSITSTAAGWATGLGLTGTESATRTGGGTTGTGVVLGKDLTAFTAETISGGAVTAYNSAGTPVNLQLRWALTSTTGGQENWNLFYQTDTTATGSQEAWVNAGTNFVFNSQGALTSPAGSGITIPGVTVNQQSIGDVSLNFSAGALTNFATTTGTATVNQITQNGYAAGQLQSVAINNNGLVVGTFSNGQNLDLASVTLSHFNGTNYLQALSGEAYAVTEQSGPAIAGASGTISGSALEGSNTDIADEFTKLIVTQQAYSANTKVITTANDMIQSLLSVLR